MSVPPFPAYSPRDKNRRVDALRPALDIALSPCPSSASRMRPLVRRRNHNAISTTHAPTVKRWPIILTQLIDHIYQKNHALTMSKEDPAEPASDAKIAEGKALIEKVSLLKSEMGRDRALPAIPDDHGLDIELYNRELVELASRGLGTWFTAPWLFAECAFCSYGMSLC